MSLDQIVIDDCQYNRVVHGSGRVGSGRVTILPDFGGSGRVSTLDFFVFYCLILST